MDAHADAQTIEEQPVVVAMHFLCRRELGERLWPGDVDQCLLHRAAEARGINGVVECNHECIALRLDLIAAVLHDDLANGLVVLLERHRHHIRIGFPERGGVLDIGEHQCHNTDGGVLHHLLGMLAAQIGKIRLLDDHARGDRRRRRERASRERLWHDLHEMLRGRKSLENVLAEICHGGLFRKPVKGLIQQCVCVVPGDDLAAMCGTGHARRSVHHGPKVVPAVVGRVALADGSAREDSHAHAKTTLDIDGLAIRRDLGIHLVHDHHFDRPLDVEQSDLHLGAPLIGAHRVVECNHECITFGLDLVAAIGFDQLARKLIVQRESVGHCGGRLVPERGRVLDIREHEGDFLCRGLDDDLRGSSICGIAGLVFLGRFLVELFLEPLLRCLCKGRREAPCGQGDWHDLEQFLWMGHANELVVAELCDNNALGETLESAAELCK
eukprot:comp15822_c0_seq1/m.24555 comp15822_c0_seq1/g.24555  ORF comp15822_c0_seq1/g.24555 comp15822_c0_seq1/m.24555 type:complete len:441 (-) comp15822_c0_seq1:20-1342(-)